MDRITRIYRGELVYTTSVTKHLVDIDEEALTSAKAELGTPTLKETVNEALRLAASTRKPHVGAALDALASAELLDRETAWR